MTGIKAVVPDAVPEMPQWKTTGEHMSIAGTLTLDTSKKCFSVPGVTDTPTSSTTSTATPGTAELSINDVFFVKEGSFEDHRGDYVNVPVPFPVLEGGVAASKKNVARGFHCSPFPKVVGCLTGKMYDVLLDLRTASTTFGKIFTCTLLPKKGYLYVPAGVAHGYVALEDDTLTQYYKGDFFDPAKEINVNMESTEFTIFGTASFPLKAEDLIFSEKDKALPKFEDVYAACLVPKEEQKPKKVWYAPHKFESYGDEEYEMQKCLGLETCNASQPITNAV
ncbi:unnamed protein product [Amoebophrya sp. A120]|nr:unnamed protein product [Amoebophrya sp. A120]|eukprot:GSA120T00026290001.1